MQRSSEEQGIAAEIVRLAHAWMDAARDHDEEALERLMAPEYRLVIMTLPAGHHAVVERTAWIAETMRRTIHDFVYTDSHVQVSGEVSVMTARSTSTATLAQDDGAAAPGATRTLRPHLTDIWVRRDERWQVVLRHSIRM